MNNNYIENFQPKKTKPCRKNTHQYTDIVLPVKLEPVTIVGEITTECCGEPSVVCKNSCDCNNNNVCELVITQTICVVIPIEFGVKSVAGKSSIKCKEKDC